MEAHGGGGASASGVKVKAAAALGVRPSGALASGELPDHAAPEW